MSDEWWTYFCRRCGYECGQAMQGRPDPAVYPSCPVCHTAWSRHRYEGRRTMDAERKNRAYFVAKAKLEKLWASLAADAAAVRDAARR